MAVRDILLIPNLLSLIRVFLAPLCYYYLVQVEFNFLPLLILGVVVILSDFLDGALARRLNQSSRLGLILDPLGDKACLFAVALALLFSGRVSPLFFIIIAAKDLLILLGGVFLIGKAKTIIPSNTLGKWTTGFFAYSIVLFIALEGIAQSCAGTCESGDLTAILSWVARGGLLAGVFLAILSLAGYAGELCKRLNRPLQVQFLYAICALIGTALCVLLLVSIPSDALNLSPWYWI